MKAIASAAVEASTESTAMEPTAAMEPAALSEGGLRRGT
jgi:hypothetical protein